MMSGIFMPCGQMDALYLRLKEAGARVSESFRRKFEKEMR